MDGRRREQRPGRERPVRRPRRRLGHVDGGLQRDHAGPLGPVGGRAGVLPAGDHVRDERDPARRHHGQRARADRHRAQQGPAKLDERVPRELGTRRPASHPHLPADGLRRAALHARRLVPRRDNV